MNNRAVFKKIARFALQNEYLYPAPALINQTNYLLRCDLTSFGAALEKCQILKQDHLLNYVNVLLPSKPLHSLASCYF